MILFEFQKDHPGKDARMLIRGNKMGERKTRVPMRTGRARSREDRNKRQVCFPSTRANAEPEACPHGALSMHRTLTGQRDPTRSSAYPSDHCSLVLKNNFHGSSKKQTPKTPKNLWKKGRNIP